jgi:hypothetical protein
MVSPLDRAREAALAELRKAPVARSWRREALRHALLVPGLTAAIALLAALAGIWRTPPPARVFAMALLLVGQGLAAWAAWAPPRAGRALAPCVVLAASAGLLVLARGPAGPHALPEWTCSATHVVMDVLPLALAVRALRQGAWYGAKSAAAVLGVGATGALLGELACAGDAAHLLIHHFGAWLLAGLGAWVVARRSERSPVP